MRIIIAAFIAVALTGCAGSAMPPFTKTNPQSYSGINHAKFSYPTKQGEIEGTVFGGKEQDSVSITVAHPSGVKVTYSASGAKAFEGQDVRRAVEQAVSEDVRKSAPGIVDSITSSIIDGLGIVEGSSGTGSDGSD